MSKKADGKRRIVIVGDDRDFLAMARMWLKPRYEVATLDDGEELRKLIKSLKPDLLILNAWRPGQDGFFAAGLRLRWNASPCPSCS